MKKRIVAESLGMFTTALGLVAALAWNEAVKALIVDVLPKGQGIVSLFIYAVVVTVVTVIVSTRLISLKGRLDEEEKK